MVAGRIANWDGGRPQRYSRLYGEAAGWQELYSRRTECKVRFSKKLARDRVVSKSLTSFALVGLLWRAYGARRAAALARSGTPPKEAT
jgi:hypothetical protein